MDIQNLWEQFKKQYLIVGEPRKSGRLYDKQLYKIDMVYAFSVYVNYHYDTCIHIVKDRQLSSQLWNEIKNTHDLTRLYIRYEKLRELI